MNTQFRTLALLTLPALFLAACSGKGGSAQGANNCPDSRSMNLRRVGGSNEGCYSPTPIPVGPTTATATSTATATATATSTATATATATATQAGTATSDPFGPGGPFEGLDPNALIQSLLAQFGNLGNVPQHIIDALTNYFGDVGNFGPEHRERIIVTGAGGPEQPSINQNGGGPHLKVFQVNGNAVSEINSQFAYAEAFRGGITVGAGDVTCDGIVDAVTGAGWGGGPHVRVFRGPQFVDHTSFWGFDPSVTTGIYVTVGDVDGDGCGDVIVGVAFGGGSDVRVYRGGDFAQIRQFTAYPGFTGGARVAAGDIDGDGYADIITGAGPTGGPHVKAFSGKTGAELRSFMAYATAFVGGVYVSTSDINGDGKADIITGAGYGGGPHVRAYDGSTGSELLSYFAYDPAFNGGVRVGGGYITPDELYGDILTGAGPNGGPHVRGWHGTALQEIVSFFAYAPQWTGGITIAGAIWGL